MRPRLILDCGGSVLSALLMTADGQLVPCSQEIRGVATRYVSAGLLFEPHVLEDPDFLWDEALETLSKAGPRDFFQRARRLGLRRPWDPRAAADTLPLASPLAVLSSPVALADPKLRRVLPAMGEALLDALLDPMVAFVAERQIALRELDAVVVLPAHASRAVRLVIERLFRRRGFGCVTIIHREIAAAMSRIETSTPECVVVDATDDDLHLHRVAIEGRDDERSIRTVASTTARGFGWSDWLARIAAALRVTPSSAFDREMIALLTGSPESLPSRLTHGALQSVLDERWVEAQRNEVVERLFEPLDRLGAPPHAPRLHVGEIFALDAVRRAFADAGDAQAPALGRVARGVAAGLQWLGAGAARRLVLAPGGSLRVNTLRGEAAEILPRAQLPSPGETYHVEREFRLSGSDKNVLVHLQWGADRAPEGNATLCAISLDLGRSAGRELRLSVLLRRGLGGSRLYGTVEARLPDDAAIARAQFSEQLEVRK